MEHFGPADRAVSVEQIHVAAAVEDKEGCEGGSRGGRPIAFDMAWMGGDQEYLCIVSAGSFASYCLKSAKKTQETQL